MHISAKLGSPFRGRITQYVVLATLVLLLSVWAFPAAAAGKEKVEKPDTHLRLEISGYRAFTGDKANGDYYISGAVELEIPVVNHASLGLRLLPLFLYPDKEDHADIYGIAAGIGGRLYTGADNTGVFLEAGASALWSMDKLKLHDSTVGFLGDCGLGYQFRSGWHLSVKAQHISDTGMGDLTGGTNGVGVATGFSF